MNKSSFKRLFAHEWYCLNSAGPVVGECVAFQTIFSSIFIVLHIHGVLIFTIYSKNIKHYEKSMLD